jgi:hypothetical protein
MTRPFERLGAIWPHLQIIGKPWGQKSHFSSQKIEVFSHCFILTKLLSYYLNPTEKSNIFNYLIFIKFWQWKPPQKAFSQFSILPKKKTLLFNAPKNHVLRDADNSLTIHMGQWQLQIGWSYLFIYSFAKFCQGKTHFQNKKIYLFSFISIFYFFDNHQILD